MRPAPNLTRFATVFNSWSPNNQGGGYDMRKFLSIAVVAAAIALSPSVYAQSGSVGTNVGSSMNEPMVVSTDTGNLRMQPNATSQILKELPKGQQVTMIGTANG